MCRMLPSNNQFIPDMFFFFLFYVFFRFYIFFFFLVDDIEHTNTVITLSNNGVKSTDLGKRQCAEAVTVDTQKKTREKRKKNQNKLCATLLFAMENLKDKKKIKSKKSPIVAIR